MTIYTSGALIAAIMAACGPMYGPPAQQQQQQGQGPQQGPPQAGGPRQVSGPPGAGNDPWSEPRDPSFDRDPRGTDPDRDPRGNDPDPVADPRPEPRPEPRPMPRPEPAPEPRADPRPEPRPRPTPGVSQDAQALLDAHNRMRAQHCAAPLTWSPKLEQAAQSWAASLRDQGCKFGHSGGQYGENLAAGTSGTLDGESVTAMWYDEVKDYSFDRGGFSMSTGHFTQVVWRETRAMGCAKTTCRGMDIWVCEYDPPGNVDRGYRANVLPTSCKRR